MAWVLVHSPIVGVDTWEPVADELRARGELVCVPRVRDNGDPPFWEQHVGAVVAGVEADVPVGEELVVVGHSGAGQLLALVCGALLERAWRVDACLFVDAGLPTAGRSRMEQLRGEEPEFADELEVALAGDGFPQWDDDLLAPLVSDPDRRAGLIRGVRRLPSGYWEEPIPYVAGWPLVPCGVLLFSDGYEATARAAAAARWPVRRLSTGNHFLALVDPAGVADELLGLRREVLGAA